MVQAVAALGARLSKSQVDRDYREGAPRHGAKAYLAWRAAFRELGRTADSRIDRPQQPDAPEPDVESDDNSADEHTAAYRADRARNERIKADRAQLELAREKGEIIAVRDVEDLEFTAGRIVRDRIQMVPARAAADLHALLLSLVPDAHRETIGEGLHLHAFERRLDTLLREALIDAATAIENARRGDDEPD